MAYNYTQEDLDLIYQNKLNLFITIDLLNKNFQIVENLQGELIDANYTVDAESDIRRNIDLTMYVKDSSFLIGQDTKIWLDKYIKVRIGIKNIRTDNIVYYNIGTYLFNDINYSYNITTKTLTLQCVDLMAQFTGLRGGQMRGLQTIIHEGTDIRQAIIDTVTKEGKYPKYRVENRKNHETTENLFDRDSPSVEYVGCHLDFENNELLFHIPIGDTVAYVRYYNVAVFEFGETYTIPGNTGKDGDQTFDALFFLRIVGKKGNEEKIQEVSVDSPWPSLVNEFTIDSDFTQLNYIEVRMELSEPYDEVANARFYNFWIFKGSGYTLHTAPEFIEYNHQGVVPYDLEFSAGATIYDILDELNNLEAGWEFFFDVNDIFVNQKIPTTIEDSYVLDWETLSPLVIQEDMSTSFETVKNSTRVWGKCLEADRYATVTNVDESYQVTLDYIVETDDYDIPNNIMIALTFPETLPTRMILYITDNYANPHYDENTDSIVYDTFVKTYNLYRSGNTALKVGDLLPGIPYVFKHKGGGLHLQGQSQVCYVVKEYNELPLQSGQTKEQWIAQDKQNEGTDNIKYIINSESEYITPDMTEAEKREYYNPFAIDEVGELRQVLSDGDYEKIYTDDLARQRAEYENWKAMRLNTNLVLEIKPIFWLDVNQKIQYKSKTTGKIEEYIIKTINYSYSSGIMTIEAVKFFPLYPFIVQDD